MGHYSVFEFQQMIWYVRVPIFTQRQWMRHRTGSYLERSLRYVKINKKDKEFNENEFYLKDLN